MRTDEITYRGFDTPDENAREVEIWLGEAFISHIPSLNRVAYVDCAGKPAVAWVGETLRRCGDDAVHWPPEPAPRDAR